MGNFHMVWPQMTLHISFYSRLCKGVKGMAGDGAYLQRTLVFLIYAIKGTLDLPPSWLPAHCPEDMPAV